MRNPLVKLAPLRGWAALGDFAPLGDFTPRISGPGREGRACSQAPEEAPGVAAACHSDGGTWRWDRVYQWGAPTICFRSDEHPLNGTWKSKCVPKDRQAILRELDQISSSPWASAAPHPGSVSTEGDGG